MPLLLPLRNKLAFPTGRSPGFDPSHPASRKMGQKHGFSWISPDNNFGFDILTGRAFSTAPGYVTPSAGRVDSNIGPTLNCGSHITAAGLAGNATVDEVAVTFALIGRYTGIGGNNFLISNSLSTSQGAALVVSGSDGSLCIQSFGIGPPAGSGLFPIAGVPYLLAGSGKFGGVSNLIMKRLDTGAVQTGICGTPAAPPTNDGTYTLNVQGGAVNLAAAMFAPNYLSMQELLQWSEDPWAFWYPEAPDVPEYDSVWPTDRYYHLGGGQAIVAPVSNKFAFPARMPGFDASHPASRKVQLSCVALNSQSNFVNILNGKQGTRLLSPTGTMRAALGPCVSMQGAGGVEVTFPGGNGVFSSMTMGCFVQFDSVVTGTVPQSLVAPESGSGIVMQLDSTGNLRISAAGFNASGFFPSAGVPYFIASTFDIGASAPIIFAITNLNTGQIRIIKTTGNTTGSASGTCFIGNYNFQDTPALGSIPAAMYSYGRLSAAEMQQWAEDPWAFWYPHPRVDDFVVNQGPTTQYFAGQALPVPQPKNKLSFPGHRAPGFDPKLVGAGTGYFSIVATGNASYVSLMQGGKRPDATGVLTGGVNARLGPYTIHTDTTLTTFSGNFIDSANAGVGYGTIAAIVTAETIVSLHPILIPGTTFHQSVGLATRDGGGATLIPRLFFNGETAFPNCDLFPWIPDPIFIAVSFKDSASWCVVKNLRTGQIKTDVAGGIFTDGPGNGTFTVGTGTGINQYPGKISAVMASQSVTPLSALVQWAESPWDFWYPPNEIDDFLVSSQINSPGPPPSTGPVLYTLSVATGFYSFTGEAVILARSGRTLVLDTGYYALTGLANTEQRFAREVPSTGFYALTGKANTEAAARKLTQQTGFYTLTGEAATLKAIRKLIPATGFYSFTGEAILETRARTLLTNTGFYSVTGENVTQIRGLKAAPIYVRVPASVRGGHYVL